jgi:enoyl-CoA hydratase/carnithine racemase
METIELQQVNGVLTISLNRPDRLNAFTLRMHDELMQAFEVVDADPEIRCVIVTGRGRGFCSGADLGDGANGIVGLEVETGREGDSRMRDVGGLVTLRIFQSTKPVIAAINGPAVGFGATMTLPMDIRLASESAKFGFVFGRRGLVPEAASSWFLPRIVGISKAAEWCYTGRVFGADEALAGGLVSSVHPEEQLLAAAQEIAVEIATTSSPVATTLTRQLLWRMLGAPHPMDAHRIDSRAIEELSKGRDAREGIRSFLEKRPPSFPMRVPTDLPEFTPWWIEPEF